MKKLSDLKVGEQGTIYKILPQCDLFDRFSDMGLIAGTKITCFLKSPLGDPFAYFVRGTLIAIRCDDSKNILLK